MKMINVALKDNAYKICVGDKILSQLGGKLKALKLGKNAVIITDTDVNRYHGKTVTRHLKRSGFTLKQFVVPAGEKSKSAKVAIRLLEDIARYDAMKDVFIIALGGGVIGDLAGYVAAVYKRGVPYIQVPTTLLAQIDSAIGGKVGIDLSVGKNLVGAFYQPRLVFSDTSVLRTLSERQMRNGLSEAVKYGVIDDKKLFVYIEKNYRKILKRETGALQYLVWQSSRIKTKIVLLDEKETKGIRTILNFGHTIGHAIETAGGYRLYNHGEAISLGMRVAMQISFQKRMVNTESVSRLNTLLTAIGLPRKISKVRLNDILRIMKHDKKFVGGKNRFVLAKRLGRVTVVQSIAPSVIRRAIQSFK